MNLGIDITPVVYGRGVSNYTQSLVLALSRSSDLQLHLYGSSLRKRNELLQFVKKVNRVSKVKTAIQSYPPTALTKMWQFGLNPIKKIFPKIEVFHSWDWIQPPDKSLPLVSTIHDLAMLKFPETAHPKILKMHQRSWKILKQRQAQVIAVSQSTKKDIVELLELNPKNVHVVYEALPQNTVRAAQTLSEDKYQQLKDKLKLDKPYLLFVGTREPRKNLLRLIEAWQPLANDFELVIAGAEGWDETDKESSAFKKNKHLRFLGRVSDYELSVLYAEAEVFVYPSLYEGFGLPILEAFYHGTPVVTSNLSAMPEVAGNAAELVDPQSVDSITKGIQKILKENKAQQQKRLQKMILRLQLFNWDKVAQETINVYQKAIR